MVATRLHEVTTKGLDWAYGTGSAGPSKDHSTHPSNAKTTVVESAASDEGYFAYATNSLWYAYDSTHSTLAGLVSSLYTDSSAPSAPVDNELSGDHIAVSRTAIDDKNEWRRKSAKFKLKYPELTWLLKNPYSNARGIHDRPSSLSAVRSLLVHVHHSEQFPEKEIATMELNQEDTLGPSSSIPIPEELVREPSPLTLPEESSRQRIISRDETAQKLAEGSLRALRDLALMEAAELHYALKFWTIRWERPILSWVEAGPWVWFSEEGYNHQLIGQKVSQIQAVLARRCAAIGELQQHLLRAGWRKGVAQWGVLGQGEQWAQIAGGDGKMDDSSSTERGMTSGKNANRVATEPFDEKKAAHRFRSRSVLVGASVDEKELPFTANDLNEPENEEIMYPAYYGHTNVPVKNIRGGEIIKDDPALAAWAVDAMRLVRGLLYGAGSGTRSLPYAENWPQDMESTEEGSLNSPQNEMASIASTGKIDGVSIPTWATQTNRTSETEDDSMEDEESMQRVETPEIRITNLPLMASEVSELLNSMEVIMESQRNRRVLKLQPPPRLRRNWYIAAVSMPVVTYLFQLLLEDGKGLRLAKEVIGKIASFYHEHVSEPLRAVFCELFTRRDRETISDRQARMDAIASCKNMIRSWLDETYPEMAEEERQSRAEAMDFSLIEKTKEESIKTIFEINSVVRMSLIEIQFIKKELMNALYAMDEMMSSNEININLAAVTPAVLVLYSAKYAFDLLFYALFKLGRSRDETYAAFRQVILDIERLLVMRDKPPMSPPPLGWVDDEHNNMPVKTVASSDDSQSVLSSDDLGMLVLLIHECRTILWRDRRRFTPQERRNVSEDLAELAGERGAVSVQQQLQIIARMCRTYSFLKVFSTGFHLSETIMP